MWKCGGVVYRTELTPRRTFGLPSPSQGPVSSNLIASTNLTSGTGAAATAPVPIKHPGDEPEANDHLDNIRPARRHFQHRSEPSLHTVKDELHERTFPRPTNSGHCRPH